GSVHVDLEVHPVLFDYEVDHAARLGEPLHVPDSENAGALQALHNLGEPLCLRGADERHVTRLQVFDDAHPSDIEAPTLHRLIPDSLEGLIEQIIVEDAYAHRVASLGESLGRPVDELDEVVEKGRLDLLLSIDRGLRLRARCATCHRRSAKGEAD